MKEGLESWMLSSFENGKLLPYYFCQGRSAPKLANPIGKIIAVKSLIFLKICVN